MRNILKRLTNIFNLQYLCLTLLLTFLFSLSLNVLNCDASSINYSVKSENEIVGYCSDLNMRFSAISEKDMIKINLQFNGKEIIFIKGCGKREGEFYVEGYSIDSGEIVTLTTKDFNTLETLMLEKDIDDNDLGGMFVSTLNLLHSWPPNLPLFIIMNESWVFFMPNFIPLLLPLPQDNIFIIDTCYDYYEEHEALFPLNIIPYIIYIPWITTEIIGSGDCLGRCGRGCIGGGHPNNEFNRYTQDCLNHDACVRHNIFNYVDLGCIAIFPLTFYDFFYAPDCETAYGSTTTTTSISTTTTTVISTTTDSETTTTTTIDICPSEKIYGEDSKEVEMLRYLRDDVLIKTHTGREIINLYYQWSPIIVKAMEADEEFKQDVKEMIDRVLGLITEGTE